MKLKKWSNRQLPLSHYRTAAPFRPQLVRARNRNSITRAQWHPFTLVEVVDCYQLTRSSSVTSHQLRAIAVPFLRKQSNSKP